MAEEQDGEGTQARPFERGALFVCRILAKGEEGYLVHIPANDRHGFIETTESLKIGDEILASFAEMTDTKPILDYPHRQMLGRVKYKAGQNVVIKILEPYQKGFLVKLVKDGYYGVIQTTANLKFSDECLAQYVCTHNKTILLVPIFAKTSGPERQSEPGN